MQTLRIIFIIAVGVIVLDRTGWGLRNNNFPISQNIFGSGHWGAENGVVRVYAVGNPRPFAIEVHDPNVRVLIILLRSLQRDRIAMQRVQLRGGGGPPLTMTTSLRSLPGGFNTLLGSGTLDSKSAEGGAINRLETIVLSAMITSREGPSLNTTDSALADYGSHCAPGKG